MAAANGALPQEPEFSSPDGLANHISFMRKLKDILDYARVPGRDASLFPTPPTECKSEEQAAQWRVQCILMSAEVRYSMYLKLLESRILQAGKKGEQQDVGLVLPPWDVAIIFYAHMLAPFNYKRDMEQYFPTIWDARVEFPIARMLASVHDDASEAAWKETYPSIPYSILKFNGNAASISSSTSNALDIRYYCSLAACRTKPARIVKMGAWVKYRIGAAGLTCPGCRRILPRCRRGAADTVLHDSREKLGMPIFNLWDSPLRQFCKDGFVDRVLALAALPSNAVERYLRFLRLVKETGTTVVPTLDIDLCWHTHQLSPFAYLTYCVTHVGRQLNHDDAIRTETRSNAQDTTAKLWALKYGESYFDPTNDVRSEEIKLRILAYETMMETKATKLAQFDDDLSRRDLQKHLTAAQAKVDEETGRWTAAKASANEVQARIYRIKMAKQQVYPTFRFFKMRIYRKRQRTELNRLQDELSLEEQEYYEKHQREAALNNELFSYWLPALNRCKLALAPETDKRRTLELSLQSEVDVAEARCWKREANGQLTADNYYDARSWYSIVPSELPLLSGEACIRRGYMEAAAPALDAAVGDVAAEDAEEEEVAVEVEAVAEEEEEVVEEEEAAVVVVEDAVVAEEEVAVDENTAMWPIAGPSNHIGYISIVENVPDTVELIDSC